MSRTRISDEELRALLPFLKRAGGNVRLAAEYAGPETGLSYTKFEFRMKVARHRGLWRRAEGGTVWTAIDEPAPAALEQAVPLAAPLPDDDIDTSELVALMARRFEKRIERERAKRWRPFTVPVHGPFAVQFWGDPHIDDNGADWPLLLRHAELARSMHERTKAFYCANIGDTTNNWSGRLARLWADQDTSASTARKLVKWFLNDAGIPWFLWLHGNHDQWPGPVGTETLERFAPNGVVMEDWGCQVQLNSPDGGFFRIHAAHDFPGHSQWNPLHGPQKKALMGDPAHLYVAGHKHNWALFHGEHEHRGDIYWLARARGYKVIDTYGQNLGFGSQDHGHSVVAVFDPGTKGPGRVQCFADPFEGADFLEFKIRRSR